MSDRTQVEVAAEKAGRRRRVDGQRNLAALREASKVVFAEAGVDAPAKRIADLAGVGVGTLYRHFPQRSDLVIAVLQHELEGCIEAGHELASTREPAAALNEWLLQYTDFLTTKRGLAAALHSGDPAFEGLMDHFFKQLVPVLDSLLDAATASGEVRSGMSATDLLLAIAHLSQPVPGDSAAYSQRMVALMIDGLRSAS